MFDLSIIPSSVIALCAVTMVFLTIRGQFLTKLTDGIRGIRDDLKEIKDVVVEMKGRQEILLDRREPRLRDGGRWFG